MKPPLTLTLTDLPRTFPISLYDATREEVRRKYRNIPGVIEVLEWGLIPNPGISDMDFSVLVEPGTRIAFPQMKTYTDDERWAMMHLHFVVSKNLFTEFRCIDPWLMQNIVPLLHPDGEYTAAKMRELGEEERHVLSYDHIVAAWLFGAAELIAQVNATGEIACRNFLENIKGTDYCHRELKRVGATTEPALPYGEEFSQLRKEWFSLPEHDRPLRIARAFQQYTESISIILRILTEHLRHIGMLSLPVSLPPRTPQQHALLKRFPGSLIFQMGNSTLVYQKDRTESELLYESWKSPLHGKRYGHGTYVFPLVLAATQNAYLMSEGLLTDQYRRCAATDLREVPVLDHPALHHCCSLMNRQVRDTLPVTGSKQPIVTYGAELLFHSKGGALRGQLGGAYDRWMERLYASPWKIVVPRQQAQVIL